MTKVEFDHNKIYRAQDLHDISYLFFPQKLAKMLRASFIALFLEIKNSQNQKLSDTSYIAEKYVLPLSSICKARAKMRKIGLIDFRGGYWGFSSRFERSLRNLAKKTIRTQVRATSRQQREKELFLVELSKG